MITTMFPPQSTTAAAGIVVLEYPSLAEFPAIGEANKLYVALDTGNTYIWTGSQYIVYKGEPLYTNAAAVPTTIGGITAGSTFSNKSIKEMWDALLYPYQAPTFTAFGSDMPTVLEVGDSIASGNKTFTWSTSNSANVKLNTVSISYGGVLGAGLANNGSAVMNVATQLETVVATHTFTISAQNTKNVLFSKSFTIQWKAPIWYGESALTTLTGSDVIALRVKNLATAASGNYVMNGGGYKWICYPTSMGLKTTFKDINTNFDVAMVAPITVNVTNQYGVATSYYCHRTYNVLGSGISIGVS